MQDQQDPAAAYAIRQLTEADLPALQAFMDAVSHHGYIRMRKNGRQVEDYKIQVTSKTTKSVAHLSPNAIFVQPLLQG